MIKFFRRIRQQLLSQNRFSKYMLYAIGEIVLVVIGILIALNINNWNNKRIEKIEERNYLERLVSDLNLDLIEIDNVARAGQNRMYQCKLILDSLGANNIPFRNHELRNWNMDLGVDTMFIQNRTFGDGLVRIRMYLEFDNNDDTYRELLASGKINLLIDEDLKISVGKHYSYLDNQLQLIKKTAMMRDNYVETLINHGISMYYNANYEEFDEQVKEKKAIIAEIENIYFITEAGQYILKYGDDPVEKRTKELISRIEEYLNESN